MVSLQQKINPYLWASGESATQLSQVDFIEDRYKVIGPQIWQDTQPEQPVSLEDSLSDWVQIYLKLLPQRLHVPEIYGVCPLGKSEVVLLENVPIDEQGHLYPSLADAWGEASAVRQLYWLWQMLDLWSPLQAAGVPSSLLHKDNLRVQGWRLWLLELHPETTTPANLQQLGNLWSSLVSYASSDVALQLEGFVSELESDGVSLVSLQSRFNRLLLETASQKPLRVRITGITDAGPRQNHNEDSYYPTKEDIYESGDPLSQHLTAICDGIGGHEGGEVASQLAVQTLKLQIRALLREIAEDTEIMSPDLVAQQLTAVIRVINNVIAARNDEQGRESRRRMATTLVMGLQLPQQLRQPESGVGNSHELYLAWVGDSRAYWITSKYCQKLTVDDDVASREVSLGRSLYREAWQRPDAGALIQALGTKDADLLRPRVKRLLIEEDGLLLLCSDGLSDNDLIEQYWQDFAPDAIAGKVSLDEVAQNLINLANEKNGHDNTTISLAYYGVSAQYPVLVNLSELPGVSVISEALLNSEAEEQGVVSSPLPPIEEIEEVE
ncbi:MAG: protein phosphatase 2C domain-containing protein, partial [Spirulinaceae cyanobacterium]